MKKLYKFYVDFGIMGELQGLFVAKETDVKDLIKKEIYFGEVLGKHSDIYFDIEVDQIIEVSDDQELISKLIKIFGRTISGYNPFDYLEEDN